MSEAPPGLGPARLCRLMRRAVEEMSLRLDGAVVLTEAATGAYAVTPVLAALAGAERVIAFTRSTRYGTAAEVRESTSRLAELAGASGIEVVETRLEEHFAAADIVTNSGHVRPLDGAAISAMKRSAVIPLMFENWEFRPGDLDLTACEARGVVVGGTNERHPAVNVFSYLGIMAVKLLLDAGLPVYGTRLLLLCDNDFGPYLRRGLEGAGAEVTTTGLSDMPERGAFDAVVVSLTPKPGPVLLREHLERLARLGEPPVIQFWGDVDQAAARAAGLPVWPPEPPSPWHMAVLPSEVGPDPVVRLQAGGLKVGEILWRLRRRGVEGAALAEELAATGFGEVLSPGPAAPGSSC